MVPKTLTKNDFIIVADDDSTAKAKANAILARYNAHEALVVALENISEYAEKQMNVHSSDPGQQLARILDHAREALDAAKGGE